MQCQVGKSLLLEDHFKHERDEENNSTLVANARKNKPQNVLSAKRGIDEMRVAMGMTLYSDQSKATHTKSFRTEIAFREIDVAPTAGCTTLCNTLKDHEKSLEEHDHWARAFCPLSDADFVTTSETSCMEIEMTVCTSVDYN